MSDLLGLFSKSGFFNSFSLFSNFSLFGNFSLSSSFSLFGKLVVEFALLVLSLRVGSSGALVPLEPWDLWAPPMGCLGLDPLDPWDPCITPSIAISRVWRREFAATFPGIYGLWRTEVFDFVFIRCGGYWLARTRNYLQLDDVKWI